MKEGDIIEPGNFKAIRQIKDIDHLYVVLKEKKSICVRGQMTSAAFIQNWQWRAVTHCLESGSFWDAEKIIKEPVKKDFKKWIRSNEKLRSQK